MEHGTLQIINPNSVVEGLRALDGGIKGLSIKPDAVPGGLEDPIAHVRGGDAPFWVFRHEAVEDEGGDVELQALDVRGGGHEASILDVAKDKGERTGDKVPLPKPCGVPGQGLDGSKEVGVFPDNILPNAFELRLQFFDLSDVAFEVVLLVPRA